MPGNDRLHGGDLIAHDALRHTEPEYTKGLLDPVEGFDLRIQLGHDALRSPHVHVERILDAQQVFLDGEGDRGKQGPIVPSHRAAGVLDLTLARDVGLERESGINLAQSTRFLGSMRDEIQQLAGDLERWLIAERGIAIVGKALDFALHFGQHLLVRALGRKHTTRGSVEQSRGYPKQAASRFGTGEFNQL